MSGIGRWGDSSDDEDDDHVVVSHENNASQDFPTTNGPSNAWDDYGEENHVETANEKEEPEDEEEENDEESEVEEDRLRRLELARLEAARKKAEASKAKKGVKEQLDDLDDILNEFGIDTSEEVKNGNQVDVGSKSRDEGYDNPSTAAKRRKNKKKKVGTAGVTDAAINSMKADESELAHADTSVPVEADTTSEIAKIIKAKVASSTSTAHAKKKPKSASQVAAAVAAKELKASASAVTATGGGDKKKKKKKDKQPEYGR